jgi:hypothetical protein
VIILHWPNKNTSAAIITFIQHLSNNTPQSQNAGKRETTYIYKNIWPYKYWYTTVVLHVAGLNSPLIFYWILEIFVDHVAVKMIGLFDITILSMYTHGRYTSKWQYTHNIYSRLVRHLENEGIVLKLVPNVSSKSNL